MGKRYVIVERRSSSGWLRAGRCEWWDVYICSLWVDAIDLLKASVCEAFVVVGSVWFVLLLSCYVVLEFNWILI